ncbi:tetratricopeptide repeat protein, partial [candidate division WOR-3 bacterium]|nr:tetratricopeptide repeat protein [candidate division WOR-3 bacterium]
ESMTGIENAVKAGDISSFIKEKEARDREYQDKMNGALIHVIENGYQEFSKSTEEQVSQLSEQLNRLSQTISDNGTSLGEVLKESNVSLVEKYSQEISDGFAKLMQNLIPVSKMSASGIMEIRDEIKGNLLAFFTEKEKKDRHFLKEAIARWIEAYGIEQKSLFEIISAINLNLEKITKSLTHISEEANQAKLTDFLQSFAKNFSAVEGKKIQMLVDFRNIVSSKILPHIHNISAIAELQKNATEASIKLASEVTRQNEGVALSNQEMTKMIGNASGSINKAFNAIEKLAAAQNQSIEKLDALSDKLDEILKKQIVVFENEQKNFTLLEKESKKSKAMIHNDRGVGFYHTKQYQSAAKEFSTAIELFPEIYEPYLNLGVVFSEIGEKEKSKKYFSKVIQMNPDAVEAYINLGMLYVFDDKFDQAETFLKESIKVSPSYARSYSALGEVYFRTKNYKLAEEAWKKALEINPMDEEASLGLKQLRGGDLAE